MRQSYLDIEDDEDVVLSYKISACSGKRRKGHLGVGWPDGNEIGERESVGSKESSCLCEAL